MGVDKTYNLRDMDRILKQNGYKVIRVGKHTVYSNGVNMIPLPKSHCEPHLAQGIIRKYKLKM